MILQLILLFGIYCCSGHVLHDVWKRETNDEVEPFTGRLGTWRQHRARRVKRQNDSEVVDVEECKDGYENVNGSTMCQPDSAHYVNGSAGVSEEDKIFIVQEHNRMRGNALPKATAMRKVYWDDELAKVAQKWAKQCTVGHDSDSARYIPKYNLIPGQNGGYHLNDWKEVLDAWSSEWKTFRYGLKTDDYLVPGGWVDIGHYAMMVNDRTSLIGCGFAKCDADFNTYYFCNYIDRPKVIKKPYEVGPPCQYCLKNCSSKICDCGKLFCFNNGELDLNKCTCTCKFPFRGRQCLDDPCHGSRCSNDGILDIETCTCSCPYPYDGDLCEHVMCDLRPDGDACETLSTNYCVFITVRKACPMLCDICPDYCPGLVCDLGKRNISNCQCIYPCGTKTCGGRGKLDVDTCNCTCKYPYTGDLCEEKECTGQPDPNFCEIYWPQYLCTFSQVLHHCPVMCGACAGPCGDLQCKNHGMLTNDCTCRCHYPFTGRDCGIKNCTQRLDRYECGQIWLESFCPRFKHVRVLCPNLCGICPRVCNGTICRNFGVLNITTCKCQCHRKFTGDLCEIERCGGKVCQNYGTLDLNTCACHCPPHYFGNSCETWACPVSDPAECNTTIPLYMCLTKWDVPYLCPYKCNHCPVQ